ncbi:MULTISPECIES: GtrA family protein [unclassified Pseudomonas]|uniref:GtrA family protein n=1 Tax=unclassified Pseudomonas TaxID=196821 RepID=UPI002AC92F5D|nr:MULTISPECIES: GtrA family protein [unclassified Pseudomonas]MEB0044989.1 GtrA family protein [Pseudomonas sp. Dout3]MEB0095999.1 GtrA family protein [Pseudomonas sp. DC1.2]WPX57863.1 GtrA family protein [Pseudomonas sp. DC1.2]
MNAFWKGFSSYTVVGVANTIIHWQVFFLLTTAAEFSQAASNFSAFCVAASFSFYVNALYTFDSKVSLYGYLLFIGFMGVMSYGVGHMADEWRLHGLVTVTSFSLLSLVCGLLYLKFFVFRGEET